MPLATIERASYLLALGTDPNNPDTDGDGLLDGFEVDHGFDPLTPGDNSADADSDGLTNLEEQGLGTDPNSSDSDQDGLTDGDEVGVHGTDPLNADTDGGGRNDGDEVLVDGTIRWMLTMTFEGSSHLDSSGSIASTKAWMG